MRMIDSHCHLYGNQFKNDVDAVMQRAALAGVQKFYLPAIDSTVIADMLAFEERYKDRCFAMMGLHPCSVDGNFMEELRLAEEWLNKRPFAAIGEIGLDFYWDKTFTAQQYDAFNIQMGWALQRNMPIVIHTRNAMQETIDAVKPFAAKGLRGIFHCFSGTEADAQEITAMGFLLGIGGVITYKNSGLAEAVQNIDLKYLVLETDAPYLTPVPFRGKRNESSYLQYIVQKLADVKNIAAEEVAEITSANAEKIFKQ
ncbi:MAG TPA: TatD family hydrolase [Chitinophagaceae bacterium]|nr:TatD family hydrolase [Chitinophagaceae bacterium]